MFDYSASVPSLLNDSSLTEVEMRNSPVLIFGQDVSHLPEGCIFMIGCMGIFILYLTYGAVQVRRIMTLFIFIVFFVF